MERIAKTVTLTPSGQAWVLWQGDNSAPSPGSFAEVVARIPAEAQIHLTLPAHVLIVERLRLPSTEMDELAGMVQLQWEKALPVPMEEISGDFFVLEKSAQESVVISMAALHPTLEKLCQPLLDRGIFPAHVTPYITHIASACPDGETVLTMYREEDAIVLATVENQRLGWMHVLSDANSEHIGSEIGQLLLTAGLNGVPTHFDRVLLASDLMTLSPALKELIDAPVALLTLPRAPFPHSPDLLPSAWREQSGRRRSSRTLRQRLAAVALVYLLAACVAGAYLFALNRKASALDNEIAQLRPQLTVQQTQQSRSTTLGPAIDPHRFMVELLFLLQRQISGDGVRLTEFDESQQQWRVVGEATSANVAIEYVQHIRQDPDLAAWQINADPPRLLTNERAQFSILGKP